MRQMIETHVQEAFPSTPECEISLLQVVTSSEFGSHELSRNAGHLSQKLAAINSIVYALFCCQKFRTHGHRILSQMSGESSLLLLEPRESTTFVN